MSNVLRHGRVRLLVVICTAIAVLSGAEWLSAWLVNDPAPTEPIRRAKQAEILFKDPALLPQPDHDRPTVLVIGNSHTYALPSTQRGHRLRMEANGILIDELATRFQDASPGRPVNFWLLSYPNFLPFEMLTRVGHLLYHGHRPKIIILGLTWRNIARDRQLRHDVYAAYRDPQFVDAFERMLKNPKVDAADDVLEAIATERRQLQFDKTAERMRSDADRLDQAMTTWAADHCMLLGRSADVRANIFRSLTDSVQRHWSDRTTVAYSYDMVEHDYDFNRDCLRALIRLLQDYGATVVCYYAPERSDLPPEMDPAKQADFIGEFDAEAKRLGVVVVDARRVVPNEYWGWSGDSPDRSHFTEVGHQQLAQFLIEEPALQRVWQELNAR